MYSNTSYSVQKKHRNTWGMKTLKMCLGKDRLEQHESIIEPGNTFLFNIFDILISTKKLFKFAN